MLTLADIGWFVFVLVLGAGYFTISAVVHELGHWLMGRLLGVTCKLESRRSGLLVSLSTRFAELHPMTPRQDVLVTSAGIAVQTSITFVILTQSCHPILTGLAFSSLPLITLNLVPLEPTDGYYLIRAIRRTRCGGQGLLRCLGVLQWLSLAASLVATACYSMHILRSSSLEPGGIALGLGALGIIISCRVLFCLRRLYYFPQFPINQTAG